MLAFPLFFYMAFAGGLSAVGSLPGFDYYNYDAFQFVFVLLQSAAFGGVFIGFSIGADFDSGLHPPPVARRAGPLGDHRGLRRRGARPRGVRLGRRLRDRPCDRDAGRRRRHRPLRALGLAVVVFVAAFLFAAGMMTRLRTLQAAPAMQLPLFMILMTAPIYVPARPAPGLDRVGEPGEPVHGDRRVRPQPDGRRPVPRAARVRGRRRARRPAVGLRAPRPAQGRGGRLSFSRRRAGRGRRESWPGCRRPPSSTRCGTGCARCRRRPTGSHRRRKP